MGEIPGCFHACSHPVILLPGEEGQADTETSHSKGLELETGLLPSSLMAEDICVFPAPSPHFRFSHSKEKGPTYFLTVVSFKPIVVMYEWVLFWRPPQRTDKTVSASAGSEDDVSAFRLWSLCPRAILAGVLSGLFPSCFSVHNPAGSQSACSKHTRRVQRSRCKCGARLFLAFSLFLPLHQ